MKILIVGVNGQLGSELQKQLKEGKCSIGSIPKEYSGAKVTGVDIEHIDITDKKAITDFINENNFDIIFNCAAFTNVDLCESEQQAAYSANAEAPKYLAEAAKKNLAKLIHISTDYVFSGNDSSPRKVDDFTDPKTIYGKSKLIGEENVLKVNPNAIIVRTAWLYGANGKNFVKTILSVAKEKGSLNVVNDQFGNPTNAVDLAHFLLKLAITDKSGIFHCTGQGTCSWYDFAKKIIEIAGIKATVSPCTTEEFPRPAKRPVYSALDNSRLEEVVGEKMRPWEEAINEYVKEIEV